MSAVQRGKVEDMGLLHMLGLSRPKASKGKLYDFRYERASHEVTLVKHLEGDRVFLVGLKPHLRTGDEVLVGPPRGKKSPTRFRVDCIQRDASGRWRAYGSACT